MMKVLASLASFNDHLSCSFRMNSDLHHRLRNDVLTQRLFIAGSTNLYHSAFRFPRIGLELAAYAISSRLTQLL